MKKHASKKEDVKKHQKIVTDATLVCPECGYETCICKMAKRSKIKKSRHEMKR